MSEFSSSLGFKTCSLDSGWDGDGVCAALFSALYRIFGIFARVQKCQEQGLCRDWMSRCNGCCLLMSRVSEALVCCHHQDHPLSLPTFLWFLEISAAETRSRRQIETIQISWDSHNSVSVLVMNCGPKGREPGMLSTNQRTSPASLDQWEASTGLAGSGPRPGGEC